MIWTADLDQTLARHKAKGLTAQQIAGLMGVTRSSVRSRSLRLGIGLNRSRFLPSEETREMRLTFPARTYDLLEIASKARRINRSELARRLLVILCDEPVLLANLLDDDVREAAE